MNNVPDTRQHIVYWHRELPPTDADPVGSHIVEATSSRVPGTLAHRDDLWDRCYRELLEAARVRVEQEVSRLGGDYAHVFGEDIEPRHNDRTGEAWMYGRFEYELYRRHPNHRRAAPASSPADALPRS